MELYNNLDFKAKTAAILFLLGKLTFFPTVYFLLSYQVELTKIFMSLCAFFVASSIVLSLSSMKSKNVNMNLMSEKIKSNDEKEKTFLVKVKNGKIIEVV